MQGLGYKRTEQGWNVLSRLLVNDEDPNVRAEAANALASYGVVRSFVLAVPLLLMTPGW